MSKDAEVVEPTPDVEEIDPLTLIESLGEDLRVTVGALRRIVRINPALYPGGPSNQYFGRKFEKAFEEARTRALKALQKLENHPNDDEDTREET